MKSGTKSSNQTVAEHHSVSSKGGQVDPLQPIASMASYAPGSTEAVLAPTVASQAPPRR